MSDIFDDNKFGEDAEVKAMNLDWGKVGDFILGTFIKARHNVETQFGPNSIYEILAEKGQYHMLTKKKPASEPTEVVKGQIYTVWGRGDMFCGIMNGMIPGQVVKLQFVESRETKMGDAKIVKVYAPKANDGKPLMNEDWLNSQGVLGGEM